MKWYDRLLSMSTGWHWDADPWMIGVGDLDLGDSAQIRHSIGDLALRSAARPVTAV